MSLLKWKELVKRKTELGNKINYVRDSIIQHKIGQDTSQGSFEKLFKPVTSKLDDVIKSNLKSRMPQGRRPRKKGEVPNYGIDIEDDLEDMNLGDLFDEAPVLPGSEKQLAPKPPTYEESLQDLAEGKKEIYVDPQYFPQNPQDYQELPPEYDDNEGIDYSIDDEDLMRETLDHLGLINHEDIEKQLEQDIMTDKRKKMYL